MRSDSSTLSGILLFCYSCPVSTVVAKPESSSLLAADHSIAIGRYGIAVLCLCIPTHMKVSAYLLDRQLFHQHAPPPRLCRRQGLPYDTCIKAIYIACACARVRPALLITCTYIHVDVQVSRLACLHVLHLHGLPACNVQSSANDDAQDTAAVTSTLINLPHPPVRDETSPISRALMNPLLL